MIGLIKMLLIYKLFQLPLVLFDRQIVNAGKTFLHQSVFVKLPILVAIGTKPVAILILIFIFKPNGNAITAVSPILFSEFVVKFILFPFAG